MKVTMFPMTTLTTATQARQTNKTFSTITPERAIRGLRSAGTPRISPDGTRIVFSLGEVSRDSDKSSSQLWVVDTDGGNARQLTWTGESHSSPDWSPDGRYLAYVSRRDGDRPNAICVLPTKGGESRELTRHAASPGGLTWSADGSTIAYTVAVDPDNRDETPHPDDAPPAVRAVRRIDYKQDNRGYLNDVRLQVMIVDVATGQTRQVTEDLVDHNDPRWSPDGELLAVKVPNRNGMHAQLGIVTLATGETILVGPEDGSIGTWAWSRDGAFILFDGDDQNSAQTDYFRYEIASGALHRLTDDLHFLPESGFPTISSPAQPIWIDDTTALIHGTQAGRSGLWTIDARSGAVSEVVRWDATHAGLYIDREGRYVVQSRSSMTSTGEIVVFDRETGQTSEITSFNAAFFEESPPARWEHVTIERHGEAIDSWLFKPADFDPERSYPVVLDVHGGPHGSYGHGFNVGAQVLASAGILVIASNPRGSSSYGRRFANLVRGDWGGEDWLDLQAVLDEVLKRNYADESRTGIYGYSYGGYMTSWAIGQTNRFKAAVCGAPVFDLESFYGTSDIGHEFGEIQWGGDPAARRDWMVERSPSTHAHRATTPTLIVHGEADERCPIGQGEQMFVALKKAGVEVEFVRYPGGSHLMLRGGPTAHKVDYYTRVLGWFRHYLLGG